MNSATRDQQFKEWLGLEEGTWREAIYAPVGSYSVLEEENRDEEEKEEKHPQLKTQYLFRENNDFLYFLELLFLRQEEVDEESVKSQLQFNSPTKGKCLIVEKNEPLAQDQEKTQDHEKTSSVSPDMVEELSCCICLLVMREPVTLECGISYI